MDYNNNYSFGGYAPAVTLNEYIAQTFGWMFLGLLVTFVTALGMCVTDAIYYLLAVPGAIVVISILELVVVIAFSASLLKRSVGVTKALFFTYAVINGVFFATYFLIFEMTTLVAVFGLTALFFGFFALYGHRTESDLSSIRPLLVGGLIFLLVAALLSIFINVPALDKLICLVGIAVFLGFTAYDVQKIKVNYEYFSGDAQMLQKASIYSALQLYLDFINLFLYLLRFLGKARSSRN